MCMELPPLVANLANARWRYAVTMPRWPHVYTVRDWWADGDAFTQACVAIEELGQVIPWPPPPEDAVYDNAYLVMGP